MWSIFYLFIFGCVKIFCLPCCSLVDISDNEYPLHSQNKRVDSLYLYLDVMEQESFSDCDAN